MNAELESDAQLEIGHVLFMDVVGFSKLLVDQQTECSRRLSEIVRNTEQFRAADAAGRLIRLPTGDGMVLVFFTSPEAPARCAMEIASALKGASFNVRMGIHSGAVNQVVDVDGRSNLAGSGINMAQRVMDCGDAGHILLSKRAAEDLEQHSKWQPRLHHLGEFEVKHGVKMDIINLYTDDVGNPALPQKLKSTTTARPRFQKPMIAAAAIMAIGLAGLWLFAHRASRDSTAVAASEKSVAIFPFKPVSSQNRDEVLENGMADTLIAKLSTIAEIIIPSLSSAQKYNEQEHDVVAAGRLLRVRSVLEGTLQRVADRIRVTARLIDVRDGHSLWSDTFDEKFTDVFAVEDAIAQKVASALALRLNAEDRQRLTKRYTDNTDAYQLYLKGRFYWNKYTEEGWRKSIEFFKQATEKDPNYALAYAGIADSYSLLGEVGIVSPKEIFPQARLYAEKALKLDDQLAEAHLSLGIVKLFYDWDPPAAEPELARARELNPTDPSLYANTHVHGFDLSVIYQVTRRFSVTLELPIQTGDRTSYYEHDFVHRFTTRASGIGDLRLIGNAWLFDPAKCHDGNISLGLGVKFPTGPDDVMDDFHRDTGLVRRPVDPAIQPGDGGWGIVTELAAFQKIYRQLFAYAQGIYLINPRDSNGVQQPTGDEPFFTLGEFGYTYNSVPDQYLARLGLGYVLWPKYGLALSFGSRLEGVPVEDFIGDSHGWRNAGYAFYVEPGLLISKGHFSFSITGPVAFKRHADKNLTDIKVSKQYHADIGGNAAFADYLVTTSFTWWF